jgi:RNAse (barnase) inhibitor barstar
MSEANTNYAETLARPDIAGVFEIPEGGVDAVVAAATANQQHLWRVDMRAAKDREKMLKTLGEALDLPPWFGNNYDALVDCLCDLGWVPAAGYVIVMENCHNIHSMATPDFNMLLDIFAEVANAWREQDKAFWCFVDLPSNI